VIVRREGRKDAGSILKGRRKESKFLRLGGKTLKGLGKENGQRKGKGWFADVSIMKQAKLKKLPVKPKSGPRQQIKRGGGEIRCSPGEWEASLLFRKRETQRRKGRNNSAITLDTSQIEEGGP